MTEQEAGIGFSVSVGARQGGGSVVTLFGELDVATAPETKRALERAIEADGEVELDMRACSFVDSMGIATLVTAARRLSEEERILRIRGAQPRVRSIFELAGLPAHRWIEFEPDGQAASA